jgi:RNA polymerase subunit RPABC4/transcription elongation factor Spt4
MQIPAGFVNELGTALSAFVAVLTALVVAFWVGLAIWTFRDIRARTTDVFAWILATVLVLLAGPIGWLLYFLLRPRETIAEAYDRQLEEEALLRDITTRRACPSCQTVTEPDWLICPRCRTDLRRTCTNCNRPLELDWVACPYCTTPVSRNGAKGRAVVTQPAEPVQPLEQPSSWPPTEPAPEPALVAETVGATADYPASGNA